MSNKDLSEDFLSTQMEVLEGWPPKEWDDAQDLSHALTEAQREAVWALYDRVEDLLWKVTRRQIQATDEVEPEQLEGALPIVHLRTLASYDHDQSHLTTWIWREGRRHARREIKAITGQSEKERRIERALSQLYIEKINQEGREPTRDEQVEYLRDHVAYARRYERETIIDTIAEIEEQAGETPSLDDEVGEAGGNTESTLGSLLPAASPGTIDADEVGRVIAEQTNRIELFERLLDEDPTSRSFSDAKARGILLELRARDADAQQIAWEHQTSPWVISAIDELYDVELTDEEVERYAISQGYREAERVLTGEEAEEVRKKYREGATYADLAGEYDVSPTSIARAVRGESPYSHFEPIDTREGGQDRALTDDEALEVRRRYEEEDVSYADLAEEYDICKSVISRAINAKRAYSHLDRTFDNDDDSSGTVTESEDSDMGTQRLQQKIDRLTSIIARASEDLSRSDAEEIRQHFDELGLTRKQLRGVHETGAVAVECALMGEGYDDFDDLTQQP